MSSTKHWTTDPRNEVNIKTTLSGPASLPPVTVNDCFKKICNAFPDKASLCVKRNDSWKVISYSEYYRLVTRTAKSLIKLGLEPHHGVCLVGCNSPEWFIGFLGTIMAGGFGVGVYSTTNKESCHYIADNCQAQICFCEDAKQLTKILEVRDRLPHLKTIVQYIPGEVDQKFYDVGVVSWNDFLDIGNEIPDYELSWRIEPQKPGHCASVIYTSGTTGTPKGVMLSHDNLTWTATIISRAFNLKEDGRVISYLPLSHIAGQMTDIIASLIIGHTVWFAQTDAFKGSLRDTLLEVRPTLFLGVPRVWEKFKSGIELELGNTRGLKAFILEKARNVGRETSIMRQQGRGETPWGHWLSNKLIFKDLREKIGLDRCRICASGAAPLPRAVSSFFYEFDMPICQVYGMSESSGLQCINTPDKFKPSAAGFPVSCVELKIGSPGPNGDGEICLRGRHVFMGYINQERKTRETIDENGWLHSGDIGSVDNEGFCFITGRSKELIITKGGENIAPVPIEERVLESTRILSNVMVVGDDQRYLTMFVTIKCKFDDSGSPTDELDPIVKIVLSDLGSTSSTVSEVVEDRLVVEHIQKCMDEVNESATNRASTVKKFVILPQDFSIHGGEMTPTMKLKRPVIFEKYHMHISRMYSENETQ